MIRNIITELNYGLTITEFEAVFKDHQAKNKNITKDNTTIEYDPDGVMLITESSLNENEDLERLEKIKETELLTIKSANERLNIVNKLIANRLANQVQKIVNDAIEEHWRAGRPTPHSDGNGKVIWILNGKEVDPPPEQILD